MDKVEAAKSKVLAWMYAQEAAGKYPWAWNAPAWGEYMDALTKKHTGV